MSQTTDERKKSRKIQGVVSSAAMDKTIVVKSDELYPHPLLGKYIRRYTKYRVHDEKNEAKAGDRVEIIESRPLSKTKRWRLHRVVGVAK